MSWTLGDCQGPRNLAPWRWPGPRGSSAPSHGLGLVLDLALAPALPAALVPAWLRPWTWHWTKMDCLHWTKQTGLDGLACAETKGLDWTGHNSFDGTD